MQGELSLRVNNGVLRQLIANVERVEVVRRILVTPDPEFGIDKMLGQHTADLGIAENVLLDPQAVFSARAREIDEDGPVCRLGFGHGIGDVFKVLLLGCATTPFVR